MCNPASNWALFIKRSSTHLRNSIAAPEKQTASTLYITLGSSGSWTWDWVKLSAFVIVLLSLTSFKRISRQIMQRHCACRTMTVWHQTTARETENRRLGSHWSNGSACFRIALVVLCHTLTVCAVLLQVEHSYSLHFALCWNYKALTSPHHLLGKMK